MENNKKGKVRALQPSGKKTRWINVALAFTLLTGGVGSVWQAAPTISYAAETNNGISLLSANRPVYASSSLGGSTPNLVTDGQSSTRWESVWKKDPQWIYLDLGKTAEISDVEIDWEGAYSTAYKLQVSNDELNWRDIHTVTNGRGGQEKIKLATPEQGRYIRLFSTARSQSAYGISIWEFRVYGTGGVVSDTRPAPINLALNKPVTASSLEIDEHLNRPENERPTPNNYLAENATDGKPNTRWASKYLPDGWIYVDLGKVETIGGVRFDWENSYARAYDIQVSDDAKNWKTIYRQLDGSGKKEQIDLYTEARYVKMQGLARGNDFGYSLFEFEVLEYREGDDKPVYDIPDMPQIEKVQVGAGSYEIGDLSQLEPRSPKFVSEELKAPFPSNDWWQSLLIFNLGESNGVITLPFKNKYTPMGLAVLTPGAGYASSDGGSVNADGEPDLYINETSIDPSKVKTTVTGYGDYSVDVMMSDDKTPKMKTTFVKGSPYLYNTFETSDSVVLRTANLTRLYDESGSTIELQDGEAITADHLGLTITNTDRAPQQQTFERNYGVFVPPGTTMMKLGDTIKIKFPEEAYLSLAALPSADDLALYRSHGYAFVTDTRVDYDYDAKSAGVTTQFTATTESKRSDMPNETLATLLPHQWKITTSPLTDLSYPSVRGTLKVHEGNTFTTQDQFTGLLPQFAEPNGSSGYSRVELSAYLDMLDADIAGGLMSRDPYWQGKKLHPLAMGVLVSDQIGDLDRRDMYLKTLRNILSDWYTYSEDEPQHSHYFHYSPAWGSIFPYASGFGLNTGLTDHHFTYGYYAFASAVLGQYDESFVRDYGEMVEHLIRDYANPSRTDSMYPWMRNFDPYEGHSWAGGFADNASGNNQEAAGEALFGWVGQFMWGEMTGNDSYRDAAIWGFTTELKAAEQYWFDYDGDNFLPGYTHETAGHVYGSAYAYTTFFSGDAEHIYGIHWLPLGEWMSAYGRDPQKAATLYDGLLKDIRKQSGNDESNERSWQHIIWPFQALSDPQAVIDKWDPSVMQQNEIFNAYWFTHSMKALGSRTAEIWSDDPAVSVYKNADGKYAAQIWNPSATSKTVGFYNASGKVGSAVVYPKGLVQVDPTQDSITEPKENAGIRYLDRSDWTLTASADLGSDPVTNMIDGSLSTRWTSGAAQNPSQWIELDLGSKQTFDTLFMNSGTSGGDYARGYQVFVSDNGEDWSEPVASGDGKSAGVAVELGQQQARYIRIESTKSADSWWSIAELRVALFNGEADNEEPEEPTTPLPGNGPGSREEWQITTFANNSEEPGSLMLDGNASTRWSSGRPQTNGQWITVDLGSVAAVDTVVLNAGGSIADSAESFRVLLSTDGSSWSAPVAIGKRDAKAINRVTFPEQAARYIKIVQTGEASNWWSIAELDVQYNGTGKLKALTPANWTLTASSSVAGQEPAALLDGDHATRWSTGTEQREGQWLTLDLGQETTFSQMLMDSSGSPDDFARGYNVYVSNDGEDWGQAITKRQGFTDDLVASFAPQSARYIKIELNESHSRWWSMSELILFAPDSENTPIDDGIPTLLDRSNWAVTTSMPEQAGYPIAAMLDGDSASRWSSGEVQSPGQWITVDLGTDTDFSRVQLTSQSAPDDYARNYTIEISADGVEWSQVTSGEGNPQGIDATLSDSQTARYVRITQTGSSDYWWSVSELNLYR
ncbi:discoidin domain-containing protein [Saccharibacillus sp. JS10]|uniref:discoidin domain-containing protein n=1 Tax=Saccharibacillus sp. JS10 TaxID=2950552 RepID=UPI002109E3FA|nr:discoidin domain-containing protein [Saccharibacillus sp. JS10]